MYDDDTEATSTPAAGGFGRKVKTFFLLLIFVVLAGGLYYFMSERNHRRYFLVPQEGNLVVKKGQRWFPVGEQPYVPDDARLALVYGPIPLPPEGYEGVKQVFEERADLDAALFDLLLGWARERIRSGEPERLERGISYLRRAEALPAYTEAQRQSLSTLQGEVAFFEGRRLLDDSLAGLRSAVDKLDQARGSGVLGPDEAERLLDALVGHLGGLSLLSDGLKHGRVPEADEPAEPLPADPPPLDLPPSEPDAPAEPDETDGPVVAPVPAPKPPPPRPRSPGTTAPAPAGSDAPPPVRTPTAAPGDSVPTVGPADDADATP